MSYVDFNSDAYKYRNANINDLLNSDFNSFSDTDTNTEVQNGGGVGQEFLALFGIGNGTKMNTITEVIAKLLKGNDPCQAIVDLVSSYDFDLTKRDADGNNLIHLLANIYDNNNRSHIAIIDRFVGLKGFRKAINVKNNNGDTPLHTAVARGQHVLAEKLIMNGADQNIRDGRGNVVATASNSETEQRAARSKQVVNSSGERLQHANQILPNSIFQEADARGTRLDENTTAAVGMTGALDGETDAPAVAQTGGISDSINDTDAMINMLIDRYVERKPAMTGGFRSMRTGQRALRIDAGRSQDSEMARMVNTQTEEIRARVLKKIMDDMKCDERTARNYLSALYYQVKEKHPELNNVDKHIELEKMATKANLGKIDIEKVAKERESHLQKLDAERSASSSATSSDEKPKKAKKDTKKEAKPKKARKSVTESGFSSTSASDTSSYHVPSDFQMDSATSYSD